MEYFHIIHLYFFKEMYFIAQSINLRNQIRPGLFIPSILIPF
jgi:hypothetical protein